jgi:hypothetical protein
LARDFHLRVQAYCSQHRQEVSLVAGATILLSGCWTAPNANLRPQGPPRVIEDSIEVECLAPPMRIESIDRANRTIVVSGPGPVPIVIKIAPGVRNWNDVRLGDQIRPRLMETLTVYVAPLSENGSGAVTGWSSDSRVLLVAPSYRLLEVQYPNGRTETFKVGLNTRLKDMGPGDSVAINTVEAVELRLRRHSTRRESSRPSATGEPGT